jgi:hypothetical protein
MDRQTVYTDDETFSDISLIDPFDIICDISRGFDK